MIFTWNEHKAEENIKNHSISFEEAAKIFYDSATIITLDKEHSTTSEIRYKARGFTVTVRNEIRIISARKATKTEINNYIWEGGVHYAG